MNKYNIFLFDGTRRPNRRIEYIDERDIHRLIFYQRMFNNNKEVIEEIRETEEGLPLSIRQVNLYKPYSIKKNFNDSLKRLVKSNMKMKSIIENISRNLRTNIAFDSTVRTRQQIYEKIRDNEEYIRELFSYVV